MHLWLLLPAMSAWLPSAPLVPRVGAACVVPNLRATSWYFKLDAAARMPAEHGRRKLKVPTPRQYEAEYGTHVFFVYASADPANLARPFFLADQHDFEAKLIAYCARLGVARWRDRATSARDAPSELLALFDAAKKIAKARPLNALTAIDQLDDFVDYIIADKPLPAYSKYELDSCVAAALASSPEPATLADVRALLDDVMDDVSSSVGFASFASDLVAFSKASASDPIRGRYKLRVIVPEDLSSVRCELRELSREYVQLELKFRRARTSGGQPFSVECMLISYGDCGQGGARWYSDSGSGWRPLEGADPLAAATAALHLCARAQLCDGVQAADCATVDAPDGRGWDTVCEVAQERWRRRVKDAAGKHVERVRELPRPVGAFEGSATAGGSSAAAASAPAASSTARAQQTPGSGRRVSFARQPEPPAANAHGDALAWRYGHETIVWRSSTCLLLCADVLDGAAGEPRSRREPPTRCRACAGNGGALLTGLKRRVIAQAKLSGKLPHKNTPTEQKLMTPLRRSLAYKESTAQLRESKALNQRLIERMQLEGIELSKLHADVIDKAVLHLGALKVGDIDQGSADDLAHELADSDAACPDELPAGATPGRKRPMTSRSSRGLVESLFEEGSPARAMWDNVIENARKRGKNNNKTQGCRYHPATISFAMRLLQKVGKSFYEKEVRRVLMLPCARHLQSKIREVDAAGDGFNTQLVAEYVQLANELGLDYWERSGCLSLDSMSTRCGVDFNANRGLICGFATHDASAAVIAGEFRAASMRLATPEQAAATAASLSDNLAGQFMVHIFTTYGPYKSDDGERRALQFVVARFAMTHPTPEYVAADLVETVTCLDSAGFHVKGVSLDGAGENEAATKKLCTLSLRHVLDAPAALRLNLAGADLDFPIAWRHPCTSEPIFFIADMGHVIKRLVNALESSSNSNSKRSMRFVVDPPEVAPPLGQSRTVCMSLAMLAEAHELSEAGGPNSAVDGYLPLQVVRGLGAKHFRKDAHSRMSVPLAVQVLSNRMLRSVDGMLARSKCEARAREYGGMRKLIILVNRLVDICNCRGYEVEPPALAINSREHPLIGELAATISFFTKWREDIDACPDFKTTSEREQAKLSVATHTGLQRLILGIIGTVMCHLPENCSKWAFNPRRAQSDPCEHLFSLVRFFATGGNPTMQGAFTSTAIGGVVKVKQRRLGSEDGGGASVAPAFADAGATKSYAGPPPGQGFH